MTHTFLTDGANEMIAAVKDFQEAQNRIFCAISRYYGEGSEMERKACDWCSENSARLEPLFGALLLSEMGFRGAVKAK